VLLTLHHARSARNRLAGVTPAQAGIPPFFLPAKTGFLLPQE